MEIPKVITILILLVEVKPYIICLLFRYHDRTSHRFTFSFRIGHTFIRLFPPTDTVYAFKFTTFFSIDSFTFQGYISHRLIIWMITNRTVISISHMGIGISHNQRSFIRGFYIYTGNGYSFNFLITRISLEVKSHELMFKIHYRIDTTMGSKRTVQTDVQHLITFLFSHVADIVISIKHCTRQRRGITAHNILSAINCKLIRDFFFFT